MDKIYLASDSKARRKILEIFGLKFKVLPSKISEKSSAKNITYPALVKNNAYKKAQVAAKKIKEGIIIGADTIVVEGGN
ncbi:septum formation protein Maf, partial [bacterium]